MHPLDGPRAKIGWAQSEVATLNKLFAAEFERYPYRVVVAEVDRKTGNHSLRVLDGPTALPDVWGVVIGEIAHNLRSAPDGLVWQLAIANCWKEADLVARRPRVGFPIFVRTKRHSRKWLDSEVSGRLHPLKDTHQAAIEGLQPYKRGNGGRRSRLWQLHELNNTDKHRLITVISPKSGEVRLSGLMGRTRLKLGVTLHPNAKIGEVGPLPPEGVLTIDRSGKLTTVTDVQVQVSVGPSVRFGTSCEAVERLPIIRTLGSIADEVSRVVESFDREF